MLGRIWAKLKQLAGNKKLVTGLGVALSVVILYFIISEFVENWANIQPYLSGLDWGLFALSVVVYAAAFLCTGENWSYLLHSMDDSLRISDYLDVHMVSALARYIPGGIWNIVGKAAMCTGRGVNKRATTVSMILEYVFQIVSSGLFLVFFVPALLGGSLPVWALVLLAAVGVAVVVLLPQIINLGVRVLARVFKEEVAPEPLSRRFVYVCIARYVGVWLITGAGLILLMGAFTQISAFQGLALMLSYPISWVVGFLSPSPNGMGVREAVLTLLLGSAYSYELLLLISLTSRVWTILGEVVAFAGFKLVYEVGKLRRRSDARVLFITTKNLDYLRNVQEIRLLEERYGAVDVIGSASKSYPVRLARVWATLLVRPCAGYEVVFVGFSPQLVVPVFGHKFRRATLVIDFFISVYDTMVWDRKKFKDGSLPARLCHWVDRRTIAAADHLVADTNAHGAYFCEEFGADPVRTHTLYLEADRSIYYPRPQVKPVGLERRFCVLYFGSVLPLQGVDVILEAVAPFADDPRFRFCIVGPVGDELHPPRGASIEYPGWLAQEELSGRIAEADLCLAGHFNGQIAKARRTIPGKAYIYDAMEKPMILGDCPANRELFAEEPGRYDYVPMGDATALREKILEFLAAWEAAQGASS